MAIPKELLLEYEKAQDSAEHHNNVMWNLVYLGIGLSLFILFKVHTENYEIEEEMMFFGIVILGYFNYIIFRSNKNKYLKYEVCKEIEKKYPRDLRGQHLKTGLNAFSYFILNLIVAFIFLVYFFSISSDSSYYNWFSYLILICLSLQIYYTINYLVVSVRNKKVKKPFILKENMRMQDKVFSFKSSVAGGLVAGGTLLAYQLGLGFGWGWLISFIVSIVVALIIIRMSKKALFRK